MYTSYTILLNLYTVRYTAYTILLNLYTIRYKTYTTLLDLYIKLQNIHSLLLNNIPEYIHQTFITNSQTERYIAYTTYYCELYTTENIIYTICYRIIYSEAYNLHNL